MKKTLIRTLPLLLASFSTNLFAGAGTLSTVPQMEGSTEKGWTGMGGLLAVNAPEYVGGDETTGEALPLIMVAYNDTVYFIVHVLGVWLWKPNDSFRLGLAAMPRLGIDADDVPNSIGGLSQDRDDQLEAGVNFRWNIERFSLEGFFLKANSKSEGASTTIKAHYTYPVNNKFTVIGGIHFENLDEDIVDYYYRPDGAAIGTSGADSATNTSALLVGMYHINKEWVAIGGIKATQLDDIIKDSPITEDDSYNAVFAGAAYKF